MCTQMAPALAVYSALVCKWIDSKKSKKYRIAYKSLNFTKVKQKQKYSLRKRRRRKSYKPKERTSSHSRLLLLVMILKI